MSTQSNSGKQKVSFDNLISLSQINNKDLLSMDRDVKNMLSSMNDITKQIREQIKIANKPVETVETKEQKVPSVSVSNKTSEVSIEEKNDKDGAMEFRKSYSNPVNNQKNQVRQFNRNNNQQQRSQNFQNKQNVGGRTSNTQNVGKDYQNKQKVQGGFSKPDFGTVDYVSQGGFPAQKRVFDNNKKKDSERKDRYNEKAPKSKRTLLRRGIIEENSIAERIMGSRKIKTKKEKEQPTVVAAPIDHAVITTPMVSVKDLSEKTGRSVSEILKKLMILGIMTNVNGVIDFTTAELVSSELGVVLEQKLEKSFEEKLVDDFIEEEICADDKDLEKRPPIVTVLGHVDHGKTSLLDYIRNSHIASGEAGGITQNISAYQIEKMGQKITFIDTPGHAAFSAMRERGASVTDIAILVVAGDDGIKPQTKEAIEHIKKAKVPMIVAVNKMDKSEFNLERVKEQLTAEEIVPEDWGGSTVVVPISALTGQGVDKLLEVVLLVAEMQNLKANPHARARGFVIEAKLDKGKGSIATVIILNGTLNVGDTVICGTCAGKVRAIIDAKNTRLKKALPSAPVAVLGLDGVPNAGDVMYVVDEKMSKQVLAERKRKIQTEKINSKTAFSMEEFLSKSADSEKKILNVIVKTDVRGSFEALTATLNAIENEEVKVECIHGGVGAITETDVNLSKSSNALLVGFNTKPDSMAAMLAEQEHVEIFLSKIIYQIIEHIEKTIKAMREPVFEEKIIGSLEVIRTFKISRIGTIAGCVVRSGKITKNSKLRLYRDGKMLVDTSITTLQRDKNDVKEASEGMECGIKLEGHNDILVGDTITAYMMEEVIRD